MAQVNRPPYPVAPKQPATPPVVRQQRRVQPPHNVPENELYVEGVKQMREGSWYRLRGKSYVETSKFLLKADDIDYNEDTGDVDARGNVYLQHFEGAEELWADRALYNLNDDVGKFYNVRGKAPLRIEARPRVLTSSSPFYFEGKWAERLKEKYVLHDGMVTSCAMPNPWWTLRGPTFDIIPDEHAIAHNSTFRVRWVPIFWTPYFYKSLERLPRRSGLLTPNIGNSSQRGKMLGGGYYWAINRSYDTMYRVQYFTERGFAHTVDFRGKPREGTDFNVYMFGVNDKGLKTGNQVVKEGGFMVSMLGRTDLGDGFYGRAEVNYLSSFLFRQSFTETYNEAISSEVHSTGFVTKQWSSFGLDAVFQRLENFQSLAPDDVIVVRKLPELDFTSRDNRFWKPLPVWISWEMSGGLLRRGELDFKTRNFLERMDVYPRATTYLHFLGFTLVPSFAVRETHYGESRDQWTLLGHNALRSAREVDISLVPPSFARIFTAPKWMGQKLKHVIEPGVTYRYVTGVNDFNQLIRFDETELYSNTNQVEYSLTNRLYVKRNNSVEEILSWDLRQQRYFDPTFGGALSPDWCNVDGCRNVVLSSIELTPFAFLDGRRRYSPIASTLRMSPKGGIGFEWRTDYDPLLSKVAASSMTADVRVGQYFLSVGQNSMRYPERALSPNANQVRGMFMWGNENRRGLSAGFSAIYDVRVGQMQFATTQVTYNTDCCGISIQYRRLSFGTRNENQFRVAFAVANVGQFGTLKKQERMF